MNKTSMIRVLGKHDNFNRGHVISEDRKRKTEPVTGHIFVSLGKLVRTVPISTLQIFNLIVYY
jgi:hypothetical protein